MYAIKRPLTAKAKMIVRHQFDLERNDQLKRRKFGDKFPYGVIIAGGTPDSNARWPFGPGRDERKAWCYSAALRGQWMVADSYKGREYFFEVEQDALLFLMTFGGDFINSKELTDVNT